MNEKMRLLVISNRYPPHIIGGYEIACHAIVERLRARGHEVLVLTSDYGKSRGGGDDHVLRLLHRPQDASSLIQFTRWEMEDSRVLERVIRRYRPQAIYAWCLFQLFPSLHRVVKRQAVPVVFNIQDIWLPRQVELSESYARTWDRSGSSPLKQMAKSVTRFMVRQVNPSAFRPLRTEDLALRHMIFCSHFQKEIHGRADLPLDDQEVIYNGIDLRLFSGSPKPVNGTLKVLFVGRLVREKGAHLAIEALGELQQSGVSNVTLSIAGVPAYPFDYAEDLRRMVEEKRLNDKVTFLGNVPNQQLPEVYRDHHVLVFPSSHPEGLPVTLLEAMACGVTVIGTLSGGSKELLEHETNCLTVPENDAVTLAERLQRVLAGPERAHDLARAGQTLVREKFDLETIVDQTEAYLRKLIRQSARQA